MPTGVYPRTKNFRYGGKGKTSHRKGKTYEEEYGVKRATEIRKKMHESHMGQVTWNKNKPWSEETKIKMREAKEGKYLGESNPSWIDGRSFEPYTSEFNVELKELIRLRDGYKCQKCGCSEIEESRKLSIHHIDYSKENCKPSNLISLCKKCNSKVNFNRPKWEKYFQNKVREIMGSNTIQLNFGFKKKVLA